MVEVITYSSSEGQLGKAEVDEGLFGDKVKKRLLKEAILMYEANRRQGTHSTLSRGEVALTGRKPYRQKGTGYARAGDYKSPIWRGGGVAFGPKPRDYSYSMPRKAKKEAVRTALLAKLNDGEVFFLKNMRLDAPRTKPAADALAKLGLNGSTLIILSSGDSILWKSFRKTH